MDCLVEITSAWIRTSVLDTSLSHHGQAICQLFEMKRLFLFIGNFAACIVENVSTQTEEQPLCKTYTRRSELFRTTHFWRVDKVSDEIKPHNKKQEIPQQSIRVLTFFYHKSFLLQFLQSPATCSIREQSNFTNLVIQYPGCQRLFLAQSLRLSCLRPSAKHVSACGRRSEAPRRTRENTSGTQSSNPGVICSLHFYFDELPIYKWTEPWNLKGRFPESWGLRASVYSSPLPLPLPLPVLFCFRSNFRAITRLETLATQASWFDTQSYQQMIGIINPTDGWKRSNDYYI